MKPIRLRRNRFALFACLTVVGVLVLFVSGTRFLALLRPVPPAVSASPTAFSASAEVGIDTRPLTADPDPLPLRAERVYPRLQFERPLEVVAPPDGSNRLCVVEQGGRIFIFPDDNDAASARVFLDIREVVSRDHNEEGLLGLAFHPQYANNGRFYVYYSTKPRMSIVSEFRVSPDDPNRADRRSERILMRVDQPYGNHNGGCIRFGPHGYLYISLGDGGSANDPHGNGQNLGTLLGSILRIDVDHRDPGKEYAVPKDNPFVDRPGARPEIWAYGLRNVWRMSFDRETGRLFAGDVGQNRYEEIDLIVRGGNYGWKIREGFHPFEPNAEQTGDVLIDPLAEYFRHEGVSVTGGIVYRGKRLKDYYGSYFYADYGTGNIWALRVDEQGKTTENKLVAATGMPISSFGETQDREMLFTSFDGHLYRLSPAEIDRSAAATFPRRLSKTGIFANLDTLSPAEGVLPYDVNVPLWSDGAVKTRLIALPKGGTIEYRDHEPWRFPQGTVLVKSFFLPKTPDAATLAEADPRRAAGQAADRRNWHRLETRLLVNTSEGWKGYTYVWNAEQTDAELLDGMRREEVSVAAPTGSSTQTWYYPSRSECMACHTAAAGRVLGLTTRQLNRPVSASQNQIDFFASLGVFSNTPSHEREVFPDWFAPNGASPETLARAYLEANCAFCHQPGGMIRRPDLRASTPLAQAQLVGRSPGQGRLGPPDSKVVFPGHPDKSELLYRIDRRGPRQMPPLASDRVDVRAVERIRAWIESLD
ncbi:MAG: hypothetical protein D6741_07240 [Planctomycetota bacterium]|nr:MAG: hypothetical protein D6741_07240 [Planctomycetota bacterium]